MTGDSPTRRSTRLSNRLIAFLLALVALSAYGLVAYHVKHGQ